MSISQFHSLSPDNRTSQVVDQIAQAVLAGDWKTLQPLPAERALAVQFGVSRNVVREATKILQSRGLLSVRQGVGTIVNAPSSEPIQHVFRHALSADRDALQKLSEVRFLVEVEIAALAAERAKARDLKAMRALLEEMESALDEPQRYVDLDMAFHLQLARATQNELFAVVLEASANLSREARLQSLAAGATTRQSQRTHCGIYEAVEQKNSEIAAERMREHLQIVARGLKKREVRDSTAPLQ